MVTQSKQVGSQSSDKKLPKPTATTLQRMVARRIGEILLDADEAMDAVEQHVVPSSVSASYEKLLVKKNYSNAELIGLLARALAQNDYVTQKQLVQEKAISRIRTEYLWLRQSTSDPHPGGRMPSSYLWTEALQMARNHYAKTGKYLSAQKVLSAVCRDAFSHDVDKYVAEVQKKHKSQIPYEDSVNALWVPFKSKYGMPISKGTVLVWLKEANLIGPSKKIGKK